jgi:hypothetical protein
MPKCSPDQQAAAADRFAATDQARAHPTFPGCAFVPMPFGELADRITILEVKTNRMANLPQAANVRGELDLVVGVTASFDNLLQRARPLLEELRRINVALWDMEDQIRAYERTGEFGAPFVAVARDIYRTNDRRAAVKRQLNELAGARYVGEKHYRVSR